MPPEAALGRVRPGQSARMRLSGFPWTQWGTVPATVTRVGVLEYEDADGTRWGELRTEEEVFAAASLATLRGAPLTDLHPSRLVTPETWKRVAIGHVGDDVAREKLQAHGVAPP